jgi:F-type H+-transporting ATPase subunit b
VNVNLTLVVQMVIFVLLIWFTMKVVWPMILGPMQERERRIAQGLAAADQGREELSKAHGSAETIIREARERANQIIDQAQVRANALVEDARGAAVTEGQRLVSAAQQQIALEATRARESLRKDVAKLAVSAAGKLLEREIDPQAHADLISKFASQI